MVLANGDKHDDRKNDDIKSCPCFDGEDPAEFEDYHRKLTWWLWTQKQEDQESGVTTARIVHGLTKKALKIVFDAIPPDEMEDYKKKEGITKLLELLKAKCGKPQSEDLQDLFKEFFFKSRIRNDERFLIG